MSDKEDWTPETDDEYDDDTYDEYWPDPIVCPDCGYLDYWCELCGYHGHSCDEEE